MTHRDTDIVSDVCTRLKSRLGADRFELWFGTETRFDWSDHTLTVSADNAFRVDRLREGFQADIVATLKESAGKSANVVFRVMPLPASEAMSDSGATGEPLEDRQSASSLPVVGEAQPLRKTNSAWSQRRGSGRKFAKLQTFVPGTCNRVAYHAARMVLDDPGRMSPLFLYGPTGVGKTHLLEGIWSEARIRGGRRIIYLSSEQFTTYFLQALKGSGLPSFRQKYRAVDLFILDDVQFLAGKQATVTELLHTMDALLRDSRQLVLAADRPPAELNHLGAELQARIAGGLVCDVDSLDDATGRTVFKRFADERQLKVSDHVVTHAVEQAPGDARQLSGIVNRLWATSKSFDCPITVSMVDDVVAELCPANRRVIKLRDIQRVVCEEFGLEPAQLCSDRRSRDVSHPRMLAMWLARKHTRAALTEIGEFFGRRSHSTVVSAQNAVNRWVDDSKPLKDVRHQGRDVKSLIARLERCLRA